MAVLIKGQSIKCTQASRDHYLRGEENEQITVLDVSGFATKNADEALQMIELSAKGTRCKKPLYSAKINPEPDRPWTRQEAMLAVQMLEENLGLTGHGRMIVEHVKKGRTHYHVLWNRFPPDGGPAKNMGNDYAIHQKTQRQIEKAFKLKPMNARGRDFKHWEVEWAKRYGYDIREMRNQITKDFNSIKSGQGFHTALKAQGIILCRGDKSQFVLVLPWGQHKALSSMIYGRPTKAVLRRALADIDTRKLPTVAEGKEQIKSTLKRRAKPRKQSFGPVTYGRRTLSQARSRNPVVVSGRRPHQSVSTSGYVPATGRKPTFNDLPFANLPIVIHSIPSKPAKVETPPPQIMPQRPMSYGNMSREQWLDFLAACEGRISWLEYFRKWGKDGLSL